MKVIKNGYPWCSRWYVEIYEYAYCSSTCIDYEAITRIYVYPSEDCNITKCLKKVWKHYKKLAYKKMKEYDFRIQIDVFAYTETEDGDIEDLSLWWWHERLAIEEELGILPF